jgi:hypothetical protein
MQIVNLVKVDSEFDGNLSLFFTNKGVDNGNGVLATNNDCRYS